MNSESIPGVIPLIKRGYVIYKEEFNTLVGLNAIYVALTFMGIAAFGGSLILVSASAATLGVSGFSLMSLVAIIVLVLFWWLLLRVLLATLYTIRDYDEHLSMRQAFARGRGKVLDFCWVLILTSLAVIGSIAIVFMLGAIIIFPVFFVAPQAVVAVLFMFIWLGSFIAILITGTWFAFTTWLFVDQNARGLHALAVSKHLSHHHLWAVMWRVFCVVVLSLLGYIVVELFWHVIFSTLPFTIENLLSQVLTNIVVCLTIVPILYCTMFSLYISVEAEQEVDTDSKAHGEHRGMLATLIFFGFLALCAIPSILGPTLESQFNAANEYNSAHTGMYMGR